MYGERTFIAILLCLAGPVWAQSSSALNLNLPAPTAAQQTDAVAEPQASPDPTVTSAAAATNLATLPEPYDTTYGDRRDAAQQDCDDDAYRKPQVHGSVGMGVAASKNASANYETTEVNASKLLGSCGDPRGEVNASISITKSNVNFGSRRGP